MTQQQTDAPPIVFSDTTLRDGEQMPGVALTAEQKVRIAVALAEAGIFSIEAGFPASGPGEVESVRAVAQALPKTMVTALCRAVERDIDAACTAFEGIDRRRCGVSLFIATSTVHREQKLRLSESELIDRVRASVGYARERFGVVAFGAEDASRTEMPYLVEVCRAALQAGATTIGYTDTVGVLAPDQVIENLKTLWTELPELAKAYLAVHFHNDLGMAVANSLAGVRAGAAIVQCTVGGLGERAGNAALEEVALAAHLQRERLGRSVPIKLNELVPLVRLVSEEAGVPLSPTKPVAGANIFATEAGIHQDGLLKNPTTYLPYAPELVGAGSVRLVLGKHSGRAAFFARAKELGAELTNEQAEALMAKVKRMSESRGWQDTEENLRALLKNIDEVNA